MNTDIRTYDATGRGAKDNFAYFEDVVDRVFFHLQISPADCSVSSPTLGQTPQEFGARLQIAPLGDLALSHIWNDPVCVRRTTRSIGQIADRHYILKFQSHGHSLFSQFGRAAYLRPGDFVLCDNTEPYQLLFSGPSEQVAVVVPEHALDERVPDAVETVGYRMSREVAINAVVGQLIGSLVPRLGELSPEAQKQSEQSLLQLVSVALREKTANSQEAVSCSDRLDNMMRFIGDHLRDPDLSPQRIADAHGISARYVHMLFKSAGSSVGRFVREQRVERCRMGLDEGKEITLTDLALEWGFSDLAHFSRSFKERYGISPHKYRQRESTPAIP